MTWNDPEIGEFDEIFKKAQDLHFKNSNLVFISKQTPCLIHQGQL